jgi:hypothetical protein
MWESLEHGGAEFRTNGWKLVVEPTAQAVDFRVSREGMDDSAARVWLPQSNFAPYGERFIRGDELHLSLSDRGTDFAGAVSTDTNRTDSESTDTEPIALELVLMAIEADEELLVLESVVSLTTSLLDSYPAVELQLGRVGAADPGWSDAAWSVCDNTALATYLTGRSSQIGFKPVVSTSLLCGDRDRVSLDAGALADRGTVRFFGDFLEKGVIRKVQPWWLWSCEPLYPRAVARIAEQLARRPLPLTS